MRGSPSRLLWDVPDPPPTRHPYRDTLVVYAGLAIVIVLGICGWLFGAQVSSQVEQLTKVVPEAWGRVREQLEGSSWGRAALDAVSGVDPASVSGGMVRQAGSLLMTVVGGLGNVPGAIIAAFMLGIIEAYSTFFMSAGWQNVITAGLVVLILIFRPSGLFSSSKVERA